MKKNELYLLSLFSKRVNLSAVGGGGGEERKKDFKCWRKFVVRHLVIALRHQNGSRNCAIEKKSVSYL
jgi:hypothetical protein